MKIVFLDAETLGPDLDLSPFSELGEVVVHPNTQPNERIARLAGADVLVTNKVAIDRELMDGCPELKLICISATGMNNVDLAYAKTKGIPVRNVAGYSTHSVAQVTLTMILYLTNSPWYYDSFVKGGSYSRCGIFTHYGPQLSEIRGKVVGIIGMGNIGKQVATILREFGADVQYYSTSGRNSVDGYRRVDLHELLQTSDIVSIHAPLNEATYGLIGLEQLRAMKNNAILINAGRGGIVCEADLAFAIDSGIIGGAGIDVFETEPLPADNPLLRVKNPNRLILLPHIGWGSIEARQRLLVMVANNIKDWKGDCGL